jgi:hypothetical protein
VNAPDTDLHEAVPGARRPNYFNGRVLTAEDLRADQDAARAHTRTAARAAGSGVVEGLRVRPGGLPDTPAVTVSAGLAVAPSGHLLELANEVAVRLVAEPRRETSPAAGSPFVACIPREVRPSGAGVYVLCVAPTSASAGRAPRVAPGTGVAGTCGPRWAVDGVLFRLVPVDVAALAAASGMPIDRIDPEDPSAPGRSRLRNVVAHALLGSGGVSDRGRDPLRRGDPDGLTVLRRDGQLTDRDVPLALLRWRGGVTVEFADEWAVRRPREPDDDPTRALEIMLGRHREGAGAATILQFAAHLDDLLAVQRRLVFPTGPTLRPPIGLRPPLIRAGPLIGELPRLPPDVVARDHFVRLPPAGVLPLRERPTDRGIVPDVFFAGMQAAPTVVVPGARIEPLLRAARASAPIDPTAGEAVWTYLVAENRMARDRGEDVQPVLVFASGHLPDIGDGRYDLGRHDHANVARHGQEPT